MQENKALDTAFEALIGAVFLDVQENKEEWNERSVRKMLDKLKYFE